MTTQLSLDLAPLVTPKTPDQKRFWAKVKANQLTGCWVWMAAKADGYGRFYLRGKVPPAHRVAYEWLVGAIPNGLHIDHLCRNRACVNPEHLEPVTPRTNILRGTSPSAIHALKTHCPSGHEYTPENTYLYRGARMCVECRRLVSAERRQSRAARQVRSDLSDSRHGTLTAYASYGCRCIRCRSTWNEYQREHKARQRERRAS